MNGPIRSFNPVEGGPAVWVEGPIGSPAQVLRIARGLREFPDGDGPVEVVVASPGGECGRGLEIYALLREHPRRIRVTILQAASLAAVVAMGGAERRIVRRGSLFLHGSGFSDAQVLNAADTAGHHTAAALRAMADRCEASDMASVAILARATGLDPAEVQRLRDDGTTIGADEALRLGFVHSIVESRV